jgi:hypothetical protein
MSTTAFTALSNVALIRIGAQAISDLADGSSNALTINAVFDYVLEEVLQARDWKFAKIRAKLTRGDLLTPAVDSPIYGYQYAYPLPDDFLRLVKPRATATRGSSSVANPPGYWYSILDRTGYSPHFDFDPPVYPGGNPYIIEVIPGSGEEGAAEDTRCILTDYPNDNEDFAINYIRKVTDEAMFTPAFKNCLIWRLDQEIAISITESLQKAEAAGQQYLRALYSAEAVNESLDELQDEAGSRTWEDAGR